MKKILALALGILSAIGGFVDIGDFIFNSQAGAHFGYALMWAVLVGVAGIAIYSEMCGRVASASRRGVFDLIREQLSYGPGLITLVGAQLINVLTLCRDWRSGDRPPARPRPFLPVLPRPQSWSSACASGFFHGSG